MMLREGAWTARRMSLGPEECTIGHFCRGGVAGETWQLEKNREKKKRE